MEDFTGLGVGPVGSSTVGAFEWFVLTSGVAGAVEAGMGLCGVVGVGTDPTDWGVLASLVMVAKFLAVFALVGWARYPVLFNFVLSAEDADSVPEESLKLALVSHCYDTG